MMGGGYSMKNVWRMKDGGGIEGGGTRVKMEEDGGRL